ncbi:MAG TPA: PcfJ domain-containing protein [Thiohalobacter sp.]|nr:PcfJ domain-containing protein [Thiohalobacter sp.]
MSHSDLLPTLPRKASVVFSRLLEAEQLDPDTLGIVLEAAQLDPAVRGNPLKAVGFLSGFLYLKSRAIPVEDTIRMAKRLGRQLNLTWSANRWREEHDRLSRLETLSRMAARNTVYDVSRYARHLPRCFKGYLIRTSRRLGMEGLRQRHCVASYHDRVRAGGRALAVVFVDRQRWTVELSMTEDPDTPLRIDQIRGRFNAMPTEAIRRQVHATLGIALPIARACAQANAGEPLYLLNLRRVLPVLREQGVGTVTVSFDGSGDSGSVSSVDTDTGYDEALEVELTRARRYFDAGVWRTDLSTARVPIGDALEEITYDYLEHTGVDWYNNDGGFGELAIHVDDGTVELQVDVRYTNVNTAYADTLDIMSGEAV